MNIAVTGATGFIGRHVVTRLQQQGINPAIVVRPGRDVPAFMHALAVVECDIERFPADIFQRMGEPATLIHLAWGGLPNYRSLHHFESELPAQYRFLKALVASGLDACVVAGTCLEYGMQSGELSESAAALPTTPYGFAKDCLRRQLEWLRGSRTFGLTWARLFYTYGDGQAATSLYPLLRAAAERGDRTFDMSDGQQLRDFMAVEEVARSIVQLAVSGRDAGIINVCSGHPVSIRQLVEGWMQANGWNFDLNLGRYPYPDYEPAAFWGSRAKLDDVMRGHLETLR